MDNKFSLYRKIRYDRTYRPLGKMSLWRVVIGSLLLLSILFFTGIMSRPFAAKGDFRTAKALLITPAWLERYHPDDMAFLNAGILYQDGAGQWQPVKAEDGYPTHAGTASTVSFSPVKTKAVRLEVTLPDNDSAGLFEWSVK